MARLQVAVAECERAVELDPLSLLYNFDLGFMYYYSRDYRKTIEQMNKTMEIDKKFKGSLDLTGMAYEQMGDYKEAVEHWIESERLQGHEARAEELAHVFKTSGFRGVLGKNAKDSEGKGDFSDAAEDYAMLGEKDAAFAALEKDLAANRQSIIEIKVSPDLDSIRSDRRYADLLRRIGLPQ